MSNSKYLQPKKYFDFFLKKIKNVFFTLENGGERVDMVFTSPLLLSDNEKCHLKRYQFASSHIESGETVGDFACGTGYGSVILAQKAKSVVGADIDKRVIANITQKYHTIKNLSFKEADLLKLNFKEEFDCIVSFETIEHFVEDDINTVLTIFNTSLKKGGRLILSTPYMQKKDKNSLRFHKTFCIDEQKITTLLFQHGFTNPVFFYQSYSWPAISKANVTKEFIICIAQKS
ncbi:MAG: class I SAM-dependent methyltransferase [Minisyncoccia bacterium]